LREGYRTSWGLLISARAGERGDMSDIDRKNPRRDDEQVRQLEYLKGMAQAPMGWPAPLPSPRMIDPADLEQMLKNHPEEPIQNPKQFRRNLLVAVLLAVALIGIIIAII
jgi:hypothetical protein